MQAEGRDRERAEARAIRPDTTWCREIGGLLRQLPGLAVDSTRDITLEVAWPSAGPRPACRVGAAGHWVGQYGSVDSLVAWLRTRGWRENTIYSADGPDGTVYGVHRAGLMCILEGRWDGGDDSDSTSVPSDTLELWGTCAATISADTSRIDSGQLSGDTGIVMTAYFDVVREVTPVEDRGISRGAAWGDYDGDGDPDLFVSRPTWDGRVQQNLLYHNAGDGRFVRVDGSFGPPGAWEGVAWVDLDNDGDLDLHVVGRDGSGTLLFENRGGTLTLREDDPFHGRVSSASMACWADADGDGRLDVFIVGSGQGRNALFRNEGSWRFSPANLPRHPGLWSTWTAILVGCTAGSTPRPDTPGRTSH
jgi:hypothetical protein